MGGYLLLEDQVLDVDRATLDLAALSLEILPHRSDVLCVEQQAQALLHHHHRGVALVAPHALHACKRCTVEVGLFVHRFHMWQMAHFVNHGG